MRKNTVPYQELFSSGPLRIDSETERVNLPTLEEIYVPPPLTLIEGPPEHEPVPGWRAWRELYTSLNSHSQESIAPSEILRGLLPSEADAVLQAGQDYLHELDSIEDDADLEIRTRFGHNHPGPLPAWVDPDKLIQLPKGVSLREILEPEGYFERFEARKQSLLDSHREYLEQLIGLEKLEWLDSHVKTAIAPSIQVVTQGRRLPPEEWPDAFREVELSK